MLKARENKGAITRFARSNHEVQYLIPSEDEWRVCEVMERVLMPFYDFTLAISRAQPSLPEVLGIMWGLDDLLDDVANKEGQFGDVGDDIRDAFKAGVAQVEHYMELINNNIIYHVAYVLDP